MKILNRIVTFVLGLAIFPAFVTRVLVRLIVSIAPDSTAYSLLSTIAKDTINNGLEFTVTLQELAGYVRNGTISISGMDFSLDKLPVEMLVTKNWLIAAVVLLVLALIVALTVMGCALFAQAHKTVMGLGAAGAACCFAAMSCFSKFAEPFMAGEIDIGKFLGQSILGDEGLVSSIGTMFMSGAISVDLLQLGNVAITMAIIFIGIVLWTFAYFITLPTDAKPVKEKKSKK